MNQTSDKEIDFVMATDSWYRTVYKPIADTIRAGSLEQRFPGRTVSDLYLYIVKHWDQLKKRYGVHYPAAEAARDFASLYGSSFLRRLRELFSGSGRK
jgi:hypothetical protein